MDDTDHETVKVFFFFAWLHRWMITGLIRGNCCDVVEMCGTNAECALDTCQCPADYEGDPQVSCTIIYNETCGNTSFVPLPTNRSLMATVLPTTGTSLIAGSSQTPLAVIFILQFLIQCRPQGSSHHFPVKRMHRCPAVRAIRAVQVRHFPVRTQNSQ